MGLRTSTVEFFFPGFAVRRALRKPERFDIAMFPVDRIGKIVGNVEAADDGEISSPITNAACVAYQLRISMTALDNVGWYPAVSTVVGVPFRVRDSTGAALVRPDRASMELDQHFDSMSGFPAHKIPTIEGLLRMHGLGFAGWTAPGRLEFADQRTRRRSARVRIGLLEVGEPAAVAGRGLLEPVLDASRQVGYRAGPGTELVFRAHRRTPLYVSDKQQSVRKS